MTVGLLSFGSPRSAFNGGRSQVNFNFLYGGGDYPFINLMKTAADWGPVTGSIPVAPDILDDDGYPTSIVNGGVKTVFYVPSQAVRPGNYVITWDGNGTIFCGMSNTLVSGSKTSSSGSGRYVFSTTSNQFSIGVTAIGSPRITNLQCFHVDDEADLILGQVFQRKFKDRIREAGWGVLRFLNWQLGNTTNVTTWATRKPIGYYSYAASERRSSLYAGITTNSGNAYAVAAPSEWNGLVDKAMVHVLWNADATPSGTCTLNIAGTGDINILSSYSGNMDASWANRYPQGYTGANGWTAFSTLVYDADLNSWIKYGSLSEGGSMGIANGIPPELMVRLCEEVGAHPYFVMPPLACTPMTDYAPSLATYCRDNGPSWMIPRFEGPNELWNGFSGFYQTYYATAKATAYSWVPADYNQWYGKVMSTLGQAVSAVYGDDRSKYQVLCGVKTATGDTSGNRANSDPRLTSAKYLLQTPQDGYTATPASDWVTHICCAQYYNPSAQGTSDETTLAAAYAGANFTGIISGTALTTSSETGTVAAGMTIATVEQSGPQLVAAGTKIVSGSGHSWTIDTSQTVASQFMTGGQDLTAPETYVATANSGTGTFRLSAVATLYSNWKDWAISHGITKMCGYEGGYSPDYAAAGNSDVDRLKAASKKSSALYDFTLTNYNNFVGLTDDGFTIEFPSCFQFSAIINSKGYSTAAWTVQEDVYAPNSPEFEAIKAFNAA